MLCVEVLCAETEEGSTDSVLRLMLHVSVLCAETEEGSTDSVL